MKFIAPENGDGFSITTNNYETATSPTFINGKTLIATGLIKNTTELTTKAYKLNLWLDSDLAYVSSTTKRAIIPEGNPSIADSTSGNVKSTRYMRNDYTTPSTVTLFPAKDESKGKIIYTTNEFSNGYYSIKIRIESSEEKNIS